MNIIFSGEKFPDVTTKSIFLAGPTPREKHVRSWRVPDALEILEKLGYDGDVFIPEDREWQEGTNYDAHHYLPWETAGLNRADVIVFWVPRDLVDMPAFTTNVEWGVWANSGKAVFGAPPDMPKNLYLESMADNLATPRFHTLEDTLAYAVRLLGKGAQRVCGECEVPLFIWKSSSFQAWYQCQERQGNRLDGAQLLWVHRTGPQKTNLFSWVLKVNVWVAEEKRNKIKDFVMGTPDSSSTLLWYRENADIMNTIIVLVKEFRSSVRTPDGFTHELPGGTTFKAGVSQEELAVEEVYEETGLCFGPSRVIRHGSRQIKGSFLSTHAHMFSIRIFPRELAWYQTAAKNQAYFGDSRESERTYIEIKTLRQIIREKLVDLTSLGMIAQILLEEK